MTSQANASNSNNSNNSNNLQSGYITDFSSFSPLPPTDKVSSTTKNIFDFQLDPSLFASFSNKSTRWTPHKNRQKSDETALDKFSKGLILGQRPPPLDFLPSYPTMPLIGNATQNTQDTLLKNASPITSELPAGVTMPATPPEATQTENKERHANETSQPMTLQSDATNASKKRKIEEPPPEPSKAAQHNKRIKTDNDHESAEKKQEGDKT